MHIGKMRIALVGTRGVPAHYGGFETCVEEVGARLASRGHEVVVYCRRTKADTGAPQEHYRGMELVYRPSLHRRSLETLTHTAASVAHLAVNRTDVAIVFNAANAPFLPVLRLSKIPVATHVDGLEWQRGKWGKVGKRYYRVVEWLSVRWSDALIADAVGIQDYYRKRFDADSDLIAYGAPALPAAGCSRLAELGLSPDGYHLVVARFEPENHVDMIVDGYSRSDARMPLVVVGSAPYSSGHTQEIHALGDERVRFLGGIWDQDLLNELYANARTYLHGHSVGGTNPSLLRAIGAGAATTAFDVVFNREVLGDAGLYFSDAGEVKGIVEATEQDTAGVSRRSALAVQRALEYDWDDVTDRYEAMCARLVGGRPSRRGHRPPSASTD